ncbi:MAG: hypothetical protein ACE5G9_04300 [Nitrospinales bacterium]
MKTPSIARENSKIREEGRSLARETENVVNTFDRVLQFQENRRLSLLARIDELKKTRQEHLSQIKTLTDNIAIYDENTSKTSHAREQLVEREKLIKENYEKMLAGALMPKAIELLKPEKLSGGVVLDIKKKPSPTSGEASEYDALILRRKNYLESLDSAFRKFEEDLFHIDEVRKNLFNAQKEIDREKEKALNTKTTLESNSKSLAKKQKKLEEELNLSIQQEDILLQEYRTVIKAASSDIEISHKADELIFSLLMAAESAEKPWAAGNSKPESKFRPKVLGKTG